MSLFAAGLAIAQPTNRQVVPQGRPSAGDGAKAMRNGTGGDELYGPFKLSGADIDAVLDELQSLTGRVVLHPAQLPTVSFSIRIDKQIPKSEVILMLETMLFQQNIGVVPMGPDALKVMPLATARTEAPEMIEGSTLDLPASSRLATKLFQLNFLRASELFAGGPTGGLQGILSLNIGGAVVVLDKANAALITDSVSNLQRIERLLNDIDKPVLDGFKVKFYPLNAAKAADVVTKLHALLTGPLQSQIGSATTYQSDDRTNSVILVADPRELPFFDDLIGKLDAASAPDQKVDVVYLKHADANTLQPILANIITGQISAQQKLNTAQVTRPGEPNAPATPEPAGAAPRPANPLAQGAVNAALSAAKAENGNGQFSQFVTVAADERSNSIIVSGEKTDMVLMRDLVEKLDLPLPQVRIQVIVAEVTLSDTDISGISALGLTVATDSTRGTHITNWAGGGSGSTGGTSIAGWDFTNGVVNPLAFNAAMNATSAGSKNVVHVLEAPNIMTAHNKPADVTVGEQVPVITGGQTTLATTGTTPIASETTSYQNVAIDLNVTPLIGDNGDIQLTIDQKVDDIVSYTTINGSPQPNIGHREAKSFVTVKDGQMMVLGGMQRTSKSAVHNKIGFLYEIPILSQLLGGHTDDLERTELLFFIRPTIVTPEQGTDDTVKRINEMSNRDQINGFLKDPTPPPNNKLQNFLDRFKDKDN